MEGPNGMRVMAVNNLKICNFFGLLEPFNQFLVA